MSDPVRFDAASQTVAIKRDLSAETMPAQPDPAIPVDGYTFGVASMIENSPHDGEMHPDGDEVLYDCANQSQCKREFPHIRFSDTYLQVSSDLPHATR